MERVKKEGEVRACNQKERVVKNRRDVRWVERWSEWKSKEM